MLMKLSNDVEKYEIEVTKMGQNYSFFLQCNIREEFLTFMKLHRITGEHLAHEIIQLLRDLGIPVENIHGQGYVELAICPLHVLECRHASESTHHWQLTFTLVGIV